MKVIDEKGRLFGKINIIDFLVIIFLLSLTPMFYFGHKLFNRKLIVLEVPKEFIEVVMDFKFIKVQPETLELVTVGDKEIDNEGKQIGEIISIGKSRPYQRKFNIADDDLIINEDSKLREIPVKLKINAELKGDGLYYKDARIAANSPINFKTGKYAVIANRIKKIEKIESIKIDLNIIFKNLTENTLKLISVGDKEINKDGEVISEILSIGKIENDTREIDLDGGNFVLGEDSSKKQISAKMRLLVEIKDDNQLYFKNNRITSNLFFEFKTDKYIAKAKISKTYESTPSLSKERWTSLNIKFSGVIPEVAKIISEGDVEKDPFDKTVGVLKKIIYNKPSDVLILKEDKFITLLHPFQKDVIAIVDFLCIDKDGITYFKNYPVRMGNTVTFTTDLYSISGTIIGMNNK